MFLIKNKSFHTSGQKIIKSRQYAPAGQSTQMIIGATGESDRYECTPQCIIKNLSNEASTTPAYVALGPMMYRLPAIGSQVPMLREIDLSNDWLLSDFTVSVHEL